MVKHVVRVQAGASNMNNLRTGQLSALPGPLQTAFFGPEFSRYGVHDDGSCFFHTVCCALNLGNCRNKSAEARQRIGHQFRRSIQKRVNDENWTDIWTKRKVQDPQLLPKVEKVRQMLGSTSTWADVYMIFVTMDLLDLNMVFFDASSDQIYCGVRGLNTSNQQTVLILWINHSHFEPIVRNGKHFLYDKQDPFVTQLMQQYHTEVCVGDADNINHIL